MTTPVSEAETRKSSTWEVFRVFLRLGLTSFGGPVAHLGYFREEFVNQRRWMSERSYADLVALCQFLPGPASSQVGLAVGMSRGGYRGAAAAWLGFTMPSAIALILVALGIGVYADGINSGLLGGLKVAAVAVVAQAVWGMARNLCPDTPRITLMAIATCLMLISQTAWSQVAVIIAAGVTGLFLFKADTQSSVDDGLQVSVSRRAGIFWLMLFFVLLLALPVLAGTMSSQTLDMIDAFYRAGALVFGGGHVVLPLLQAEVVPTGWVSEDSFLAGYGAAQAVPGPLFTFAAFLGAAMNQLPTGWLGGFICLLAIFVPSFLLIAGALPFWQQLRQSPRIQSALMGVNAAVVGLLLAALYDPVWTSGVSDAADFGLALMALVALAIWRLPPWLVVASCAVAGWAISLV
ncbi:chromate efflux transporter [Pseudohongiella sp. SYSU M77423]|mgnify:CR=1 FL=1|uniref:chromate efflux transporter n=1 Tax=Pseudohongiella sp. SYSU M77423 TaxID=3042312 RepID=UPI00248183D8|nr:chromate efflux transporter [Pseudohongiella sp. SYSU M77423]MDH7944326.1 chromate efflux transporter [Pseudohongiella sp. SYSU M77423]